MSELNDFEYERRFYCRELPKEYDDGDPTLIIQSYYVYSDNYALRIRLEAPHVAVPMDEQMDIEAVLDAYREHFDIAFMTVKGPAVGGTRYETEKQINTHIAAELIKRGGRAIIKNRVSCWIANDGWSIDVFGGDNYPLIIAEAVRSSPVTDLTIPHFCITEITDESRFNNDGLAEHPFGQWQAVYEAELAINGPRFEKDFGTNTIEGN